MRKRIRSLIVTAHPDDESMFFVPTIVTLRSSGEVFLLCLSPGNATGLGEIRKRELEKACEILKIKQFALIDRPELQDGPQLYWDPQLIASIVEEFSSRHDIHELYTFDGYGISGHPNHISVYKGIRTLVEHGSSLQCYILESTALWRKFLGPLEALYYLKSNCQHPLRISLSSSTLIDNHLVQS